MFGRLFAWTRLSTRFSPIYSVVTVCVGDIHLLFKLLLKFRNVFTIYRENMSSSSLVSVSITCITVEALFATILVSDQL